MSRQDRFSWFAARRSNRRHNYRHSSSIGSPYARRLRVEQLEDRRMLAVLMVNSPLDNITPGDNLVTLR